MKSNICPKCRSNKIVSCKETKSNINTSINISAFKVAIATKYICCEYSYFEQCIDNLKELELICKKLSK